ncbi:hypothetical protein WDW89_13095 [Deltaproteobacteria bacterium TL4]
MEQKPIPKNHQSRIDDIQEKRKKTFGSLKELSQDSINFKQWQERTILIVEEALKQQNAQLLVKLRNKILGTQKKPIDSEIIDGMVIAKIYPTREVKHMVQALRKNPLNSVERLKLIKMIIEAKVAKELQDYRNIMLQSMIPVYSGDITLGTVQMVIITYRAYLDKLMTSHKKKLLTVQSKQLRGASLKRIQFDVGVDNRSQSEKFLMSEIKVAQELFERSETLLKDVTAKLKVSLHFSELDGLDVKVQALSDFFSDEEDKKHGEKKKKLVLRKTLAVIDTIKSIPLLHSVALKLVEKLKAVDDKLNYSYALEGRIYMQSMQYQIIRIEAGDQSVQNNLIPIYSKAVAAYKKALTLTKKETATKSDLPILIEFALVTHYGYIHRDLMRITKDGILDLLKQGKETIDNAVLLEPSLTRLQSKILIAIKIMEEDTISLS